MGRSAAEDLRELVVRLLDHRHRFFHGAGAFQLQWRTLLRHNLRAMRYRMPRIEWIRMLVRRQEFIYLPGVGQLDIARDVGDEEPVWQTICGNRTRGSSPMR